MIHSKEGQKVKLTSRQIAVVIIGSILIISLTGAVTYAALSATGRFGSHGRIVAIGL